MKITIESTPVIVEIDDGVAARRWEGATESGIPVVALVGRVSPQTHDEAVLARFVAELEEREPPPAQPYAGRVETLSMTSCGRSPQS